MNPKKELLWGLRVGKELLWGLRVGFITTLHFTPCHPRLPAAASKQNLKLTGFRIERFGSRLLALSASPLGGAERI